jgi:plastocyanin
MTDEELNRQFSAMSQGGARSTNPYTFGDSKVFRTDETPQRLLVGTTVDFPNSDPVYHNVFSVSAAKKFDLGLYPQGETRSTTFDKPGVAAIRCNTHPKMEAYIVVKEHPYFTVPNERGIYQLGDIPLGSYTLQVWHPKFGTITRPVALERGEEVLSIDFDLTKAK